MENYIYEYQIQLEKKVLKRMQVTDILDIASISALLSSVHDKKNNRVLIE